MKNINKNHLVVGLGEVGLALSKVFKCDGEDPYKNIMASQERYDFLHIAFPYSKTFIKSTKEYIKKYNPQYTIIHSTVPVGTSDKIEALHSPIRGVHPHLARSIQTFKKFLGGKKSREVAEEFKKFKINCICVDNSRDTEALKLWDTTQYGVFIMLNKEIYKYCNDNNLDFNTVYTLANQTYNEGYTKMSRPEVMRPFLEYRNEKVGGHCVINNAKILKSSSSKMILKLNKSLDFISKDKYYVKKFIKKS